MKTVNQMFGKVVRDIAATERAQREDQADRERRAAECEERLDAPLTRREVLEAIDAVGAQYSLHQDTAVIELLARLAEALG